MSKIEVDKIDPQSGTALEVGTSGDTVTVPSGVGLTLTDSTLLLPATITSTTEVKTNKISPATGVAFALGDSGDTFTVPSGATIVNSGTATGFGGGKLLQIVSATRTGFQSITPGDVADYVDLTGLSVAITPAATSSKVFISFSVSVGQDSGGSAMARVILDRDGSTILIGDDDATRTPGAVNAGIGMNNNYVMQVLAQQFLDSPSSTAELTYKLQAGGVAGRVFIINETIASASTEAATATSTITAMEIGA